MFPQQELHPVSEFVSKYSPQLRQQIAVILSNNKMLNMYDDGEGSYDAEFQENDEIYNAEATLNQFGEVEDCYCSCHKECCDHIYTLLWCINKKQSSN